MASTKGAPAMLENGNAVQSRRCADLRTASYVLIFVCLVLSALVPIIFCLLYHQRAQGTCWAHGTLKNSSIENMTWIWNVRNCEGIVQYQEQYLIIQQRGEYFIYAQLFHMRNITEPFTLVFYKYPNTSLNNIMGHEKGSINFARPFPLEKGDKLFCSKNHNHADVVLRNWTYWGLFKI